MVFRRRDRRLANLYRVTAEIRSKYEPRLKWKSDPQQQKLDPQLVEVIKQLKERATESSSLESLLPEAYALARVVASHTLGMRPYDNQIAGAVALYRGMIIEMANGDGKTLTATLPTYLKYLEGQKVHIATYNDYLARRDAEWMGPLYAALGMSVSIILPEPNRAHKLEQQEGAFEPVACSRKEAYNCDVTYGTYQDFVFDYLRDNMVVNEQDIVQNSLDYIILDEVDSVLIDLARTPFIIATEKKQYPAFYYIAWLLARSLRQDEHYILQPLQLTQTGIQYVEGVLRDKGVITAGRLYSEENAGLAGQIIQSLNARHNYARDRDYIVKDGRLLVIDRYSGRPSDSTYGGGLQQAIQVKEGLPITPENVREGEISYQHFFKLYKKMAGMTATAVERKDEFRSVYSLPVVVIPSPRPSQRIDLTDLVYRTHRGRMRAVADEVKRIHSTGRPILIDTQTIERAEEIGQMLGDEGIHCEILDAKHPEDEWEIIAAAGQKGTVTVAARMAGRGTDIVIADEALACKSWHSVKGKGVEISGLHVIGIERNESRHLDRQLIGRTGRQNKPGSSQFFLALEDDLLRRFAADRVSRMMRLVGMEEDEALESGMIARLLEQAQERVEEYNLAARQQAYEFDGVLDKQRQRVYSIRRRAILHKDLSEDISIMIENVVLRSMKKYLPGRRPTRSWDVDEIRKFFDRLSPSLGSDTFSQLEQLEWRDIKDQLINEMHSIYDRRIQEANEFGVEHVPQEGFMRTLEEGFLVMQLDKGWHDHLRRLENLQQEMNVRAFVQKDQLGWYMMKSNELFWKLIEHIEVEFLTTILGKSSLPVQNSSPTD